MVRATAARCLVRLGGAYPSGWDATSVGNLCTQADYVLDAFTAPTTLSTTDDNVIEVCVDIVLRMMEQADRLQSGSGTGGLEGRVYPDRPILSDELKDRIERIMTDTTEDGFTTVDMIEDE